MLKFSRHMYIGRMANSNRRRILWDLKLKRRRLMTYVIVLSDRPGARIEMLHNSELLSRHFDRSAYTVYGFAEGKIEGLTVLRDILTDAAEKGEIRDPAAYLRNI